MKAWWNPHYKETTISMPPTDNDQALLEIAEKADKLNQQLKQIQTQVGKADQHANQQEAQMQQMQEAKMRRLMEKMEKRK